MKKILKLLIGTNNKGKYREIRDLLPKYIKTLSTINLNLKSPKENGLTFVENSIIKSKYFSKKTKLICLADDSGLEIDLLNKDPGIYSSRWGGTKGDFHKAIKKVYRKLTKKDKNWQQKKLKQDLFVHYQLATWIKKLFLFKEKLKVIFQIHPKEQMVLVMILFLFQ